MLYSTKRRKSHSEQLGKKTIGSVMLTRQEKKRVRAHLCTHSKISPELYTLNSQPRYPVDVFNVQLVQSLLKCTQGTHCHVGHLKYKDTKYNLS